MSKPKMWVLETFRFYGPNIVGYDQLRLVRMAISVLDRRKTETLADKVITLFEDGTWLQGLHESKPEVCGLCGTPVGKPHVNCVLR